MGRLAWKKILTKTGDPCPIGELHTSYQHCGRGASARFHRVGARCSYYAVKCHRVGEPGRVLASVVTRQDAAPIAAIAGVARCNIIM